MTWLGNPDSKLSDEKRATLLKDRERLVNDICDLKKKGPGGSSAFKIRFFNEDLNKLAKLITSIDQKLGRPVDRNSGGSNSY